MTTPTPAGFSAPLNNALADLRAAVGTLSPDDAARVLRAVNDLEPVLKDELEALARTYTARIPVFGGLADEIINAAINKSLDDMLAHLTAVKAGFAS